jgi:hypothetical protein
MPKTSRVDRAVSHREFPISTLSLRKNIGPPPRRVDLESSWPRLSGKRGSFLALLLTALAC